MLDSSQGSSTATARGHDYAGDVCAATNTGAQAHLALRRMLRFADSDVLGSIFRDFERVALHGVTDPTVTAAAHATVIVEMARRALTDHLVAALAPDIVDPTLVRWDVEICDEADWARISFADPVDAVVTAADAVEARQEVRVRRSDAGVATARVLHTQDRVLVARRRLLLHDELGDYDDADLRLELAVLQQHVLSGDEMPTSELDLLVSRLDAISAVACPVCNGWAGVDDLCPTCAARRNEARTRGRSNVVQLFAPRAALRFS